MKIGRTEKVLLSAAAVVAAASVAGVGTYAGWNTSQAQTQAVSTGTFTMAITGNGFATATNAVSNIAPGDSVTRYISVQNSGTTAWKSLTLAVSGTQPSGSFLLDGTSSGLQMEVQSCATAWSDTTPASTCSGGATSQLSGNLDVAMSPKELLPVSTTLASLASHYLKVTVSLPSAVGSGTDTTAPGSDYSKYGNKTASLTYTIKATQRDGIAS